MDLIIQNLDLIIFVLLLVFGIGYNIFNFLTSPSEKRQELVRVWLIQAVTEAEIKWNGKGLGYIKFSEVYQKLISEYGLLAKFISKELIEKLIEEALIIMKKTLETNPKIAQIVNKEGEK